MKIYLLSEREYDYSPILKASTNRQKLVDLATKWFQEYCEGRPPEHYLHTKTWEYNYGIQEIEVDE